MKRFFMGVLCVFICGEVDARRLKNPFEELDRKLQTLPIIIRSESSSGSVSFSAKMQSIRRRRALLLELKRKKYLEEIKGVGSDLKRLYSSRDSLVKILETDQGQKKKGYYEKRVESVGEDIKEAEEMFDWINECFGEKAIYTSYEDATRKNEFESPWMKLERFKKINPAQRTLSSAQVKDIAEFNKIKRSIRFLHDDYEEDFLDKLDKAERSAEELEKILDTDQGQKKESYYSKRLAAAVKKAEDIQKDLDWLETSYKIATSVSIYVGK